MCPENQDCEAKRQPLQWNGSANTPVAMQWIDSLYVMEAVGPCRGHLWRIETENSYKDNENMSRAGRSS
jgi:hypothetical protein